MLKTWDGVSVKFSLGSLVIVFVRNPNLKI